MQTKNIGLIFTGGTIAMVSDPATGTLRPPQEPLEYAQAIPELFNLPEAFPEERPRFAPENYHFVCDLDSTNITPDVWKRIAATIYKHDDRYDGFVVTHGTDTMTYTAAALAFMLKNLGKPVVLTGAQLPLAGHVVTDARPNLLNAFRAAALGHPLDGDRRPLSEVAILFGSKLLRATRAVKLSGFDLDAFTSYETEPLARIGLRFDLNQHVLLARPDKPLQLNTALNTNVTLLKIHPGLDPRILDAIIDCGIEGLVIEALGTGNIPNEDAGRYSLLSGVQRALDKGVVVVITTQLHIGGAELLYDAGAAFMQAGAISGLDMTPEAALVKLMWALGNANGRGLEHIRQMLHRPLAGEITLHT